MNVNKKLDRLKQWGKERMGGEAQTTTTEEFKALEVEMDLRHSGMDRLQTATSAYIKSLSTRTEGSGKDKVLPLASFANTLSSHGEDFEPDSEFGSCLLALGRANERIARMQETYAANATSSWLESVERSQVQMQELKAARKKLEQRRLAYDAAGTRVRGAKKEDFRAEEELRGQRAKYEESCEEVWRRMMDVKEAEADSVADLTSFLEAEMAYYERCREVLQGLRRDWPASQATISRSQTSSPGPNNGMPPPRRPTVTRSRASSITTDRFSRITEEPSDFSSNATTTRSPFGSRSASAQNTPARELAGFDFSRRPSGPVGSILSNTTTTTSNGYNRDTSPAPMPRLTRMPTEPTQLLGARNNLKITKRGGGGESANIFGDEASDVSDSSDAPSRLSLGRSSSWSLAAQDGGAGTLNGGMERRKPPPPPPPPSRSTKPGPPPLPLKRSALSSSEVPYR